MSLSCGYFSPNRNYVGTWEPSLPEAVIFTNWKNAGTRLRLTKTWFSKVMLSHRRHSLHSAPRRWKGCRRRNNCRIACMASSDAGLSGTLGLGDLVFLPFMSVKLCQKLESWGRLSFCSSHLILGSNTQEMKLSSNILVTFKCLAALTVECGAWMRFSINSQLRDCQKRHIYGPTSSCCCLEGGWLTSPISFLTLNLLFKSFLHSRNPLPFLSQILGGISRHVSRS